MASATELQTDINRVLANGTNSCFRYFTTVAFEDSTEYDDDLVLAQSGTDFWTTGLIMPLGTKDSILVQQGQLRNDDKVLYVVGTVQTSGLFKVGIGSPGDVNNWFASTELGVKTWQLGETDVYKKLYIRRLTTGSLAEE